MPVSDVQTKELLKIYLPNDNIFGMKGVDRNGLAVAYGWVTLLDPLTPGAHAIALHVAGVLETGRIGSTVTTTISVV